jgi:serine O-acetyltransferase
MKYDGDSVKEWAGDSQWRAWRADLARFKKHGFSGWGSEGFWALTVYRAQRGLEKRKPKILWLLPILLTALLKKLLTTVTHINLDKRANIGPGMIIPHVGPIQVHPLSTIGADCAIHQVTTIGAGPKHGGPVIGDHVYMGSHICVLGPVRVGNGAKIGAGAVVIKDVPPGTTAVGVPARILGEPATASPTPSASDPQSPHQAHTPPPDQSS